MKSVQPCNCSLSSVSAWGRGEIARQVKSIVLLLLFVVPQIRKKKKKSICGLKSQFIDSNLKSGQKHKGSCGGQRSFYCGCVLAGAIFPARLQLLTLHFVRSPPLAVARRWPGRRTAPSATLTPVSSPSSSPFTAWVLVLDGGVFICSSSRSAGFFADTVRKGSVVSRANSIGSTSASSVPNTGELIFLFGLKLSGIADCCRRIISLHLRWIYIYFFLFICFSDVF